MSKSQKFLNAVLVILFLGGLCMAPAWASYPPPGNDYYSVAGRVLLEIEGASHTVPVSGQILMNRKAAIPSPLGTTIPTQIVEMHLTGTHPELGIVRLEQDPVQTSNGEIHAIDPLRDYPVESFFDVFFEIDIQSAGKGTQSAALKIENASPVFAWPPVAISPDQLQGTPQKSFVQLKNIQPTLPIPILAEGGVEIGNLLGLQLVYYPKIYYCKNHHQFQLIPVDPSGDPTGPPVLVQGLGEARLPFANEMAFDEFGHGGIPAQQQVIRLDTTTLELGEVKLRESQLRGSPGQINNTLIGQSFPAESFFDIFLEIQLPDLPGGGLTLFNQDPVRVTNQEPILALPLQNIPHTQSGSVLLYSTHDPSIPRYRLTGYTWIPIIPFNWWIPRFSIYIIKIFPPIFPIPGIVFNLFLGTNLLDSGATNDQGVVDFLDRERNIYQVEEIVPPEWDPISPPIQVVDLNTAQFAEDFYRGFGGEFPPPGKDRFQIGLSCQMAVNGEATEEVTFNGILGMERLPVVDSDGDLLHELPCVMNDCDLVGDHPAFAGPIRLSLGGPSAGRLETHTPGHSYPADSFFDIFFSLETPDGDLDADKPVHVAAEQVDEYPPVGPLHYGGPDRVTFTGGGGGAGKVVTISHVRLIWLPWFEYVRFWFNKPKPPTPTPTSTATATPTPTETITLTPSASETSTPSETRTEEPTVTMTEELTPTASETVTVRPTDTSTLTLVPTETPTLSPTSTDTYTSTRTHTQTQTLTRIPTPTPTYTWTRTPSRTPTSPPALTPTPTVTRTRTSTPTVTPTVEGRGPILYTIERDYYLPNGTVAYEGDVLIEGSLAVIDGGRYEELLRAFLADPVVEGRYLGLDGLDAISIQDGVLTRVFFSVEKPFKVTRPGHPLFGLMVSDGDLLAKSGLVVPNAFLLAPFDPRSKDHGEPAGDIGLDGIDIEGITPQEYDAWSQLYYETGGNPLPPAGIFADARLYLSFELDSEEYITGPAAAVPPGPGVLISADDVLLHALSVGTGSVFRSGADHVPAGPPSILEGYFPQPGPRMGLDALDMPNYTGNSDEAGETGPVTAPANMVLFSTERNDPVSARFREGDLLSHTPGVNTVYRTNEALTGLPPVIDLGLDGVDWVGNVPIKGRVRTVQCDRVVLAGNINSMTATQLSVPLWAIRTCGLSQSVAVTFEYDSFVLIPPDQNSIVPGPNFQLLSPPKLDKQKRTLSFQLQRVAPGANGELLALMNFLAAIGFEGNSATIEWLSFKVDDEEEIAGNVNQPEIGDSMLPSRPSLMVPDPIGDTYVQINWFLNNPLEEVTSYQVSLTDATGEVVSAEVSSASNNYTFTGLDPGSEYQVALFAINAQGPGEAATLLFSTRFDRNASQGQSILSRLSTDWNPAGGIGHDVQSQVPSPVDIDLDGRVGPFDAITIIEDHETKALK